MAKKRKSEGGSVDMHHKGLLFTAFAAAWVAFVIFIVDSVSCFVEAKANRKETCRLRLSRIVLRADI